jgi:hypothetical protein
MGAAQRSRPGIQNRLRGKTLQTELYVAGGRSVNLVDEVFNSRAAVARHWHALAQRQAEDSMWTERVRRPRSFDSSAPHAISGVQPAGTTLNLSSPQPTAAALADAAATPYSDT